MLLLLSLLLAGSPDAGACARRADCALDAATRTCRLAPGEGEGGPVTGSGLTCVCEAGACATHSVEPVPCASWKDCSWTAEPFLHPVSSKQVPRAHKHKVRPCKDAERDSVCDDATKTCRVLSWKC